MRRTALCLCTAMLAMSAGCLSSIIPDHSAATSNDAGVSDNGGKNDSSGDNGSTASSDDGGAVPDGGVTQSIPNDPNCIQPQTATIDGHHHPGEACLQCHDGNTAGANKFTAAGTVYDIQTTPPQPVSGATIELIDANGTKVTVVTASQGQPGNFWTDQPLVYPVKVRGSKCPFDRPMPDPLADGATPSQAGGNCAKAGCHDVANQIHIP